jgi:enoyl-CoA hydratase/carnithine racemase
VPAADLDAAVADLAAALLATDAPTARAVKKLLLSAARNTLEEQSAAERRAQADLQTERLGPLAASP